jgi:A1 cistron-splicing factor AAR2
MESANSPALLLLDLPPSALAGIDLLSFTTTPRFRGVKEIPSGLHFAFTGANAIFSERHGLWFSIAKVSPSSNQQPLIITRWDPSDEILKHDHNPAENLRWRANLGEFWREGLTPYRQSSGGNGNAASEDVEGDWATLTNCITPSLLTRIAGDPSQWSLSSGSSASQDIESIPGFSASALSAQYQADQILHFLPINLKQTWRPGALGSERSEAAQDRSWALLNLLPNTSPDPKIIKDNLNEILGELQFCFIVLLTLNNFSALEQWKRLLTLIFTSVTAVFEYPDYFVRVIAALRLQLQHCKDAEGGLIDLTDEGGSLLASLLTRFRRGFERASTDFKGKGRDLGDVVDEIDDLEEFLREQHGWQFDEDDGGGGGGGKNARFFRARSGILELEDGETVRATTTAYDEEDEIGEFAPEIVELTEEQRRIIDGGGGDDGEEVTGGEVGVRGSDWGTKRARGMGKGLFVEDRTVQRFVVEEDDDDDDDDTNEKDERNERTNHDDSEEANKDEDSEEEDDRDLEDMDSRY